MYVHMFQGNYGAVTSNLPGGGSCPFSLKVTRCQFYGCAASGGKGGALAIFDTSASLVDTMIQHSVGTGLVFESSSATGEDQLTVRAIHHLAPRQDMNLPGGNYAVVA